MIRPLRVPFDTHIMHISGRFSNYTKADIEESKANIEEPKADIEASKADIEKFVESIDSNVFSKTMDYIVRMYNEYGSNKIFGRSMVEQVTDLKATRASELIKMLLDNNIIEPVQGYGKGKYRFR